MGNICRSPAAEIIFRKLVADAHLSPDFVIDSAGTIGHHRGAPPDQRMASALQQKGYIVSGSARTLELHDLDHFDLILSMDEDNLSAIRRLDRRGAYHYKIRPFVDFCTRCDDVRVPDPYYGGQQGFNYVLQLLEDGCAGILARFAPRTMAIS